jgi:hypothetical protein
MNDVWKVSRRLCKHCRKAIHSVTGSGEWTHVKTGIEECEGMETVAEI